MIKMIIKNKDFSQGLRPIKLRMMNYRLYLFFVFLVSLQIANARRIEVVDFKKGIYANDFDIEYILSQENYKCALVVIKAPEKMTFNADLGVERQYEADDGSQLLLLPQNSSKIFLSKEGYPSLKFSLPEKLEANNVYVMTISLIKDKKDTKTAVALPVVPQRSSYVKSTDIELSNFCYNPNNLIGSINPEYDNTGQACAVIRCFVNNEGFVIEPNLGVVKSIEKSGEIIQYVPVGTKRLTVRNGSSMPIINYEIPFAIQSKRTYDVTIILTEKALKRQKAFPEHDNFLGIGYNNPNMCFTSKGGNHKFTIHCNSSWDVSAPSWCKLSKVSGTGVMEINVLVKNNPTPKSRHGVIGIQSQDITVTIIVEQEAN